MKRYIVLCVCMTSWLHADVSTAWQYGNAAALARNGKWKESQELLNQLITNEPDRADYLYDSGVAAYRLSEFEKAAAYFENVLKKTDLDKNLKKQTLFNLGNTCVALNQLPYAVQRYEDVLSIDPQNRLAQHNLEVVRQMLQQQQQDKNQKNNKNKKEEEGSNADQHNDGSRQPQKSSEQNSQKETEGNQGTSQGSSGQQEPIENKQNSDTNESGQSQRQQSDSTKHGQMQQSMDREKEEGEQANDQNNRDQKSQINNESNQQDSGKDQNDLKKSHTTSPCQQEQKMSNDSQATKNDNKEQVAQKGSLDQGEGNQQSETQNTKEEKFAAHEKWMVRVLEHQEKADEKAQKTLIKKAVNKQLAGQNGQNCW